MARATMQHFRARTQKSGRTYYYFDTGQKPRKEIPLGSDYIVAVRKWAELKSEKLSPAAVVTFIDVVERYERDELPKLAASSQITYRADLKHLRKFFGEPPAPLEGIRPKHIEQLLERHSKIPTTANRLRRLFSVIFNFARRWDYTNGANPTIGTKPLPQNQRDVYVTDEVFRAVWEHAVPPLRDAMDLAYLTGQRPGDVLNMTEEHLVDGHLQVRQNKTGAKRRIRIEGELAQVLERIQARKATQKVWCGNLTVNLIGKRLAKKTMRTMFVEARDAAAEANPKLRARIKEFWFYDLRAKAADDVADTLGAIGASNLLGHTNTATTEKHYLRKGRTVGPTK